MKSIVRLLHPIQAVRLIRRFASQNGRNAGVTAVCASPTFLILVGEY